MRDDELATLAEWAHTPEGRTWFAGVRRDTTARRAAAEERVALVARIAEAERAVREDVPVAHAATVRAGAALAAARAAFEKAERAHYEAGLAESRLRERAREDRRRAEGRLRVTADPRLAAIRDRLLEAAHHWPHAANELARYETRGEFMEAHQVMVNREELAAMHTRIDDALARVETLLFVAESSEDEIVAAVVEGEAASERVLGVVRRHFA